MNRSPRFYDLGQSDSERNLVVVSTVRGNLLQSISARDMRCIEEGKKSISGIMKKKPQFRTDKEERDFRVGAYSVDFADYNDWLGARRVVLPNLKPSLKTISLRLPEIMIKELKLLANKGDVPSSVPHQSLNEVFLSPRIPKRDKKLDRRSFSVG